MASTMLRVLLALSHFILRQSSETGTVMIHPTVEMKQLSLGEAKWYASKEMLELGFEPGNHTPKPPEYSHITCPRSTPTSS